MKKILAYIFVLLFAFPSILYAEKWHINMKKKEEERDQEEEEEEEEEEDEEEE